jgi:opacity protein-like surface antigen
VSDAWSIGAEYRYTDLGDRDFAWPDFTDATYDLTSHAVRARASYHF